MHGLGMSCTAQKLVHGLTRPIVGHVHGSGMAEHGHAWLQHGRVHGFDMALNRFLEKYMACCKAEHGSADTLNFGKLQNF